MPREGTVLLVENDEERARDLGRSLESAGYEVMRCIGPTAPGFTCIGDRYGYCPVVERADVVVLDPWLAGDEYEVGTTSDDLIKLYTDRGRSVIVTRSAGSTDPRIHGQVMHLRDGAVREDVVNAVASARDADGLVLRRI